MWFHALPAVITADIEVAPVTDPVRRLAAVERPLVVVGSPAADITGQHHRDIAGPEAGANCGFGPHRPTFDVRVDELDRTEQPVGQVGEV